MNAVVFLLFLTQLCFNKSNNNHFYWKIISKRQDINISGHIYIFIDRRYLLNHVHVMLLKRINTTVFFMQKKGGII